MQDKAAVRRLPGEILPIVETIRAAAIDAAAQGSFALRGGALANDDRRTASCASSANPAP